MSVKIKSATSLSIARHSIQFILRCALDAEPAQCCGLIGHKNSPVIAFAMPLTTNGTALSIAEILDDGVLQAHLKRWAELGITPAGIYFSTEHGEIPDIEQLKQIESAIKWAAPAFTAEPFIHMPLLLNTAGCLEAFAYRIQNSRLISIPLTLEEDGQRIKNG